MPNEDIEYLKHLPNGWESQPRSVIVVAKILDKYGSFASVDQAINFMAYPQEGRREIDFLIREWGE